MGGLVGLIGEGSLPELEAMAARMPYRGRARTWSPARDVYFGELSAQTRPAWPMASPDFALDTAGDSTSREDIERALKSGDPAAAATLRGFFATAWWDERARAVKLVCDRHGYKTLYVARLPGRVAFASDVKALLALPDMPASVDRDVLQTYLRSRSFPSQRSLLASAIPVGGASIWTLTADGTLRSEPYWVPQRHVKAGRRFNEAAMELRGILQAVLRRQLLGREQVGLALSGGLDSVSVLALARSVCPEVQINTYTVGHSRQDPEIVRAREAASHFRTEHHECFLPAEKVPAEMRRFVWLTEDLTGREEAVLQQVLTEEMAAHEDAYVAGHGADAAFAGMPRHRLLWLRDHAPPPVRGALEELFVYTQRRAEPRSWLGRHFASLAFHGDRPQMPRVSGAAELPAESNYANLDQYCCATVSWIEGMRFHEPAEAAGGIAMITPFFDPAVIEFALSCPPGFLIDSRTQKRILRAAVRDLLPAEMSRRGKMIQRLKHDTQLSDVLDEFAAQLRLREALTARQLLPASYVTALQKRSRGSAYSSERLHILWALICAELWLRQFIDQRGVPNPSRAPMARAPITRAPSTSASHPAPMP